MPNQQLIDYIKKSRELGHSDEAIKALLINAGHKEEDVSAAFIAADGKSSSQGKNIISPTSGSQSGASSSVSKTITSRRKINFFKRTLILAVLLVFASLAATAIYELPKVKDFIKVRAAIKQAKEKQNLGEYQVALDVLNKVGNYWSLESQKLELTALKSKQEKFINYEQIITISTEKENTGNLKEARDLLQSVGADYPKYKSNVQSRLSELQEKIEKDLEIKASVATTAKAEAETRAQAEASARIRSDAAATAAAEQARQAEYQRQQEAIRRAEEVAKSFLDQLIAGYNSYNKSVSYYSSAISYSNSGDSVSAFSEAGAAMAALEAALNSVSTLNSRFASLPSDYYTATEDMMIAIYYLSTALDLFVKSEGTDLKYSTEINDNKDLSLVYANSVKLFLDSVIVQ